MGVVTTHVHLQIKVEPQNEVTDIEMFIFSRTTHEEYPEKKSLQTTFYGWMILVIYDVL